MSDNMSSVQSLTYYYPTGQRAASAVTVPESPIPWWALIWVAIGAFIALLIGFALLSWRLLRRHQRRRVKDRPLSVKPPAPLEVTKKMRQKPQSKPEREGAFF